jgi:hypothetical protein
LRLGLKGFFFVEYIFYDYPFGVLSCQ